MSPAEDARHDSSSSTAPKRHGCTPETSERIQGTLQNWARDSKAAAVYWMSGTTGTGKSTIAYSLSQWLENSKLLGASFFCSRASSSCRNVGRIVPTIACQLAHYSYAFRFALSQTLQDNSVISTLNVTQQFEKLIRAPMLKTKDALPDGIVIVIDGLDECEDDHGIRLILEVLLRLASDLPLKFFVTSCPEIAIRDKMLSPGGYPTSVLHRHNIEDSSSTLEEDIKKYLTKALGPMSLSPTYSQIEQLAKRAGNLFIYAATAVRYILPANMYVDPSARLKIILETDPRSFIKSSSSTKHQELDALYTNILATAFNNELLEAEEIEAMRLVLWMIVCVREPMTIHTLASLLGLTERQVSSALRPLRSVLHISTKSRLVSMLHKSFSDYMLDRTRSGDFYCNVTRHSQLLASRCFDVMKEQLRFNICDLKSSFVFDKDIPYLEDRVDKCISPVLLYACCYWSEHLRLANASEELHDKLADFVSLRLLFWMEVLNLSKSMSTGTSMLLQAQTWLSVSRMNKFGTLDN
jgi:hypothetical protein